MPIGSFRRRPILLFLLLAAAPLSGCGSLLTEGTATGAGIAGAGIAGAVSQNAAVGTAIGLGVAAAGNAGVLYLERTIHSHTQDEIAAAAGSLPVGAVGPWSSSHTLPIERGQHGQVVVSREIDGPDFACKEIIFSVEDGTTAAAPHQSFFTTYICRDGTKWRWATAEPATARWGALQ